ncbi:hypothetical protein [Paenibacillus alkalitolerans]|uniref:hypothetical protein n=1 Tax=Paenibacillus alkalitolerans TaxID=2799335 RepID=UPI0018F2E8F0|nr:hypothetical protein [Paenibacillus alkalitolerans]
MLRLAVLTFLSLSGIAGFSDSSVFAHEDEATISAIRPKIQLFNFSAEEIQSAQIKWSCCYGVVLTRDEIKTLVTILSKIKKEDITPYTEPAPKGGPTRCEITLISNERVGFVTNGGYLLVGGGKVYLPEFSHFVGQISKHKNRVIDRSKPSMK